MKMLKMNIHCEWKILSLNLRRIFLLLLIFILWQLSATARSFKRNFRNGQIGDQYGFNRGNVKNGGLFPSVFNVAAKADIYVNATCGEDGPEIFCKPSETSRCAVCDARSPDPGKHHNISNVLNYQPGKWWQSPTLARDERFEYVSIILDLKQVYQIENVIVKAANSPRPAAWVLERSIDGEEFRAWQYYAPSDEECWSRYSIPAVNKPVSIADDEVICTSMYSKQAPLENGEIHTNLLSGRIGAQNHSEVIEKFSQARYVKLNFQGLRRGSGTVADKRRAFYSIKEISIGGRCVCSGHASRCRYSPRHGHQECDCERHTCGETCEKCCPMFNQLPWKPGTSGKGFHCEKCNCHGHATSCRYDPEIAERKMSLDIKGKYRGGGVCINCTEHTSGINCEKCQVGYYRPNGVPPDDPHPCVPCDHCNMNGSTGFCSPDDSYTGKVAGACECKPGFSGYKCDQCAAGYRQFPDCMPCPCDPKGILPSHDCEGDCLCKANVEGEFCENCKLGYFALTHENIDGCMSCDCSNITQQCTPAKLIYQSISTLNDWLITDINASQSANPAIDPDNGWPTILSFEVDYPNPYWLAPRIYSGNRISSYGSNLTYSVSWIVMRGDTSGKPTIEYNVILVGNNGMKIGYGEEQYNNQEAEISIPFKEQGWYHLYYHNDDKDIENRLKRRDYQGEPVTRSQMLKVLADIKYIMIRAQYHSEQVEGNLMSVVLPIGELSEEGSLSLVEKCECPEGYTGFSCENCAWGYVKIYINGSDHQNHHICVKCDCNNHAESCNLIMGECIKCEHHTFGPKCDRCAIGYYGDPTRGTSNDCKKCACPLVDPSNQFSPSCQLDDIKNPDGNYVCTQCPLGYTGDHCESCDEGYYGNPMELGGKCRSCTCNGGTCDPQTGRCLECRGNTEGWRCERCKEAHYGNPLEQNCLACNCDVRGSSSNLCDSESGQCLCLPLFTGRDCSKCIKGYGNVGEGCRECNCGIGAMNETCDSISGNCMCLPGVIGPRCDQCNLDHYGLSTDGCIGCRCNVYGSKSTACDIVTGQCQCKLNVEGRQCNQCKGGYYGLSSGGGCSMCNCDPVGSFNISCHEETGQCYCRPGVGGLHCDSCLPGYYGFSKNGCNVCETCEKRGHVCDSSTGRCLCPKLTLGEHCDRCRPGSYNLIQGVGCKLCDCTIGSMKSQCNSSGQCPCRLGFDGLKCDRCAPGYYGYPKCKPCNCNQKGTLQCPHGLCYCDNNGQCPCKDNVIGRQCDQCKESTFGLSEDNEKGCTECFCFGRSSYCQQAHLIWGQRYLSKPRILHINDSIDDIFVNKFGYNYILPNVDDSLNITNGLSIIPETQGDIILPDNFYFDYPLYWQLPDTFLGDKIISYNGFLKFKTSVKGGTILQSNVRYPLVQIQGNNKIVLEYYPEKLNEQNEYKIRMHESQWQLQNRPDYKVNREILMVALQSLQYILIQASEYSDFEEASLLEASLDAAVMTPTHFPPLAIGIEICECPPEYNNTSCQDPSLGYYRWFNNTTVTSTNAIDLIGQSKPCQCNNRSEICDLETGYCMNCRDNTAGDHCEICAESFYGNPEYDGCKACPCPYVDKRFASGCNVKHNEEVVCHCKPGYTGDKCEQCSYGYYGYPEIPGGVCIPCNCNKAGSASDECDEETGQCNCKPGSTGRDCSQCTAPRHVFIQNICTSCNDNCTGILLDDLAIMSNRLTSDTSHIVNGYIPPPWVELTFISLNATNLMNEIERIKLLNEKMKDIPNSEYKKMNMKKIEKLLKKSIDLNNKAWNLKAPSEDFKNNIFSSQVEIRNLKDLLEATTNQLIQYGKNIEKLEINKTLNKAQQYLDYLKSVNISDTKYTCQNIFNDVKRYINILNNYIENIKPFERLEKNISHYNMKSKDMLNQIEDTIENLFIYDKLYNSINSTYFDIKDQKENISNFNVDTLNLINEGVRMNEEANGFIIDIKNNFQDMPKLRTKLDDWSQKLDIKEEILYRLNYEYEDKYVSRAVQHAQNISNYVDKYVALFDKTRNDAANSLKASQAYKNIIDSLTAAKSAAEAAKRITLETYNKIFPNGDESKSLLDDAAVMSEKSADQLEKAQELENLFTSVNKKLNNEKQSVNKLKEALNTSGIKDNKINIKLRDIQSNSNKLQEKLIDIKIDHKKLSELMDNSDKLINDYNDGITNNLKARLYELKREGDSKISLASEKLTEAQSNIKKIDAKLISLAYASNKRQVEFDKWNETISEKIKILKNKIIETRNTAEGINIALKSNDGKKCVRSYKPNKNIYSSTVNSIIITIALTDDDDDDDDDDDNNKKKDGILLYLGSSTTDDFMAIEMIDRKIKYLWNTGGGVGVLTHPEVLKSGDLQDDSTWYRIEVERIKNIGRLSVRKQVTTNGGKHHTHSTNNKDKYTTVVNSTNPNFDKFDISFLNDDRLWIGGITNDYKRPNELLGPNGIPGCIHKVIIDGKPLGLWNFLSTSADNSCKACIEGVEESQGDDITYSFNGDGYAVRNRVTSGLYNKYTFGVSLSFKTLDENSLLFLAINQLNKQHFIIYLRDGRVILQIGYGSNISIEMSSTYKYNNGNWTKIDAFRQYQLRKNIEKCSLSINGDFDKKIGAPTPQPKKDDIPDLYNAKYYIGGISPTFKNINKYFILPTDMSFLGCMSNINIQEGYDPMAEQYYGVEPTCYNKPLKIVGYYGNGYLKYYKSYSLKKISSFINLSFRTIQLNAFILLSTFHDQSLIINNKTNDDNKNNYYSIAIVNGQIQIRLNAGKGQLILQSNSSLLYNDGKYHSISIIKKRKKVELIIDDAYQSDGKLPSGAGIKAPESNNNLNQSGGGGLYFGGLPIDLIHFDNENDDNNIVGSIIPFYGAIKDVIINQDLLRFDKAYEFNNAYIGRSGPKMGLKELLNYTPISASLSRDLSTQPEGCQKVPYYSLEPGALKFGDKSHSHTQLYLNFKKFWEKKYIIEFDFRTYYPNGLLFITPGIKRKQYLMIIIKDGQLMLLMKSKQKKEIVFKIPCNDGNWHHVIINHVEKKLTLLIDSQIPKMIKVPKKIGLETMMYIGGLPESGTPFPDQVVDKLETLKGCIRSLKINGNIYDMVGSTSRPFNVGQCFPSVESGAYFQDEAYAIYKKNFNLGSVLELQFEFRTSELSGVLLSSTASEGSPSLSLELNNGKIIMGCDLGNNNPIYVEQHFSTPYTICDNRWHKIQAIYNSEELALKIDDLDQKYGLPTESNINHDVMTSTASIPLYIGGLPASASKGTLLTRDHFNGCIRNVMIAGERRDWTDMAELHNIHLSSCPIQ